MSKKQSEKLAFKDFKNAIPMDEFESILKVARHEYKQLTKVHAAREKFRVKSDDSIKQIQDQSEGMPPGLAKKEILPYLNFNKLNIN